MRRRLIDAVSAAASSQIFWYLSLPWLSRAYTPEAFGLYGQFLAYAGVASLLVAARADLAILTTTDEQRPIVRSAFFKLSLWVSLALAAVLCCVLIFWRPTATVTAVLCAALCSSVVAARFLCEGAALIHADRYSSLRGTAFMRSLVQSSVQVSAFAGGAAGLVVGKFLGDLAGIWGRSRALSAVDPKPLAVEPKGPFGFTRREVDALRANARAYQFSLPQTVINATSQHLPMLALPLSVSAAAVGQYALAFSIVVGPIGLIAVPVRQMLTARFARARYEEGGSLQASSRIALAWSAALGLCAVALYAPLQSLGNRLVELVFGSGWSEAGDLLPLLWMWAGTGLALTPAHALLLSYEGNRLHLVFEVVQFVGRVCAMAAGLHFLEGLNILVPFIIWSASSNLAITALILWNPHVAFRHR